MSEIRDEERTRVGDLEIYDDLRFQRRSWAVQRAGWLLMALVVITALLGYLGQGPVSDASVRSADGAYEVEYSRYARHRSPENLRVAISPGAVDGDAVHLSFDRRYLDGLEVESVFPEAESVEVGNGEVVYQFKLREAGVPAVIMFSLEHEDIGRKSARVRIDGRPPVEFSQFIYP